MRSKKFSVLLGSAILTLALPLSALAAGDVPGTPGDPNCKGQTNAFIAQLFKEGLDAPGLGNVGKFFDVSVKDIQAFVTEFCNQKSV